MQDQTQQLHIQFLLFHYFLNIWTQCHGIKKMHWKVDTFEGLFQCVHTIIIKIFIIWCTWFTTIIFWFSFCERIVSKFIFFTRVLSIGARLAEESRGQFYFDNRDVQAKGSTKVFKFLKISFRAYNFITNKIIRSPNIFLQTKNTDVILSYYIFDF